MHKKRSTSRTFFLVFIFTTHTITMMNVYSQTLPPRPVQDYEKRIKEIEQKIEESEQKFQMNMMSSYPFNVSDSNRIKSGVVIDTDTKEELDKLKKRKDIADKIEKRPFLPVRNEEDAKVYFIEEGFTTITQVKLYKALGENGGSITTDLLTDFWGPVRAAFGASISNGESADTTERTDKRTLQTFFAGGGNASLSFAYPFLFLGKRESIAAFEIYFLPRIGMILPQIGTSTDSISFNFDFASETYFTVGRGSIIQAFAYLRLGRVLGTDYFLTQLGLNTDSSVFKDSFWFGQWSVGLTLTSFVRISVSGVAAAPKKLRDSMPITLSVQMVPNR